MKRLAYIIVLVLAVTTVTGCGFFKKGEGAATGAKAGTAVVEKKAEKHPEGFLTDEQAAEINQIVLVMNAHMSAFEREDLEKVAATLHPDSPQRDATLGIAALLFESLDGVEYDLSGYEYKGDGKVDITQMTKGKAPFRNNTVKACWEFRKDAQGKYKLWETTVRSITYEDAEVVKDKAKTPAVEKPAADKPADATNPEPKKAGVREWIKGLFEKEEDSTPTAQA